MILAKPIIADQFWILKKDNRKIGNVIADNTGYVVTIENSVSRFKTIRTLAKAADIEFENTVISPGAVTPNCVHGYNTGCQALNPVWDVKHKLPLFTKNNKSKSWFAAGWYTIKQHRAWKAVQNPKLIVLERYSYQGPFHTKEQANESI
jgi:hypothetical protein